MEILFGFWKRKGKSTVGSGRVKCNRLFVRLLRVYFSSLRGSKTPRYVFVNIIRCAVNNSILTVKLTLGEWSPLSDNERKDSVSMNVEFVKLHLSRSRKIHVSVPNQPAETRSFHQISSDSQHAAIRFSSKILTVIVIVTLPGYDARFQVLWTLVRRLLNMICVA